MRSAPGATSSNRDAVASILQSLKRLGSKRGREEMGPRYGIAGPTAATAFGVSMRAIQKLAKDLVKERGLDHALALALWETGQYEARALAAFIDDPAKVTSEQMDAWAKDFDNWGTCDTVCFKLFDRVAPDLAFRKVRAWSKSRDEFVKRGAFALLASLALHDRVTGDSPFAECLPLIKSAASDERNFVKKGVSWALRSAGRRSATLNRESVALAKQLSVSTQPAERWIGKDAFRELTSPAVRKRVSAAPRRARTS
jgi:3-methyladenine DNA glycosylase AlkD